MTIADPEALRVVLDAVADLGCISSVTVDEKAWRALTKGLGFNNKGFTMRTWNGVEVRLGHPPHERAPVDFTTPGEGTPKVQVHGPDGSGLLPLNAITAGTIWVQAWPGQLPVCFSVPSKGEDWRFTDHNGASYTINHQEGLDAQTAFLEQRKGAGVRVPSLPQPSGEGGWLLRPLPGFEALTQAAASATEEAPGAWLLGKSRRRPCATTLQWQGRPSRSGLERAEVFLAMQEGREPISVWDLHKFWPTVEACAKRCARPRESGQEFVPFCEIVRVDNGGREMECQAVAVDPAECGCCGAFGDTPCDDDCDAYRQGALQ